jgi:hypothetical protein
MVYILFVHMYTTGLVLGHMTLILQTHFDPGGHAVGQLLEQGQGEVTDPHRLDCPLQLGQGGDGVISFQSRLHNRPHVLDRIEIRGISRPVHHCEGLLPKQGHGDLDREAGAPSCRNLVTPWMAIQGNSFSLSTLMYMELFMVILGGEKEQGTPALPYREAPPHHNTWEVLHVRDHELLLIAAHCRQTPDLL